MVKAKPKQKQPLNLGADFEKLRITAAFWLSVGDREPAMNLVKSYSNEASAMSAGTIKIAGNPVFTRIRDGLRIDKRSSSPVVVDERRRELISIAKAKRKIILNMIKGASKNKRPATGQPQPYAGGQKRRFLMTLACLRLTEQQMTAADRISSTYEMAQTSYISNCIMWDRQRVDISRRPFLMRQSKHGTLDPRYLEWCYRNNTIALNKTLTRSGLVIEVLINHIAFKELARRERIKSTMLTEAFRKALDDF